MLRACLITFTTVAGLGSAALALTPPPQPCELYSDGQGDEIRWIDHTLQHGAVLMEAFSQPGEQYRYTFEDCRTGTYLRVMLSTSQSADWQTDAEPVRDVFYKSVESDKSYTLRGLRTAFRKAGYKTQLKTNATESCGCNAYYPQLRGNKKPYEATQ